MGRVIGIDLGTTNSCVAVVDNGQPAVVPNTGGYRTTPSMFAISQDGKRLVGHLAKRQAITNSKDTVYASKRLIGRRFDSPETQQSIDLCPYEIVRGPNDDPRIKVGSKTFTCPEIAGIILREMKRVAEEYLGLVYQRAGNGDALLFAARELIGPVFRAFGQSYALQHLHSPLPPRLATLAGKDHRQADVLPRSQSWQEIK